MIAKLASKAQTSIWACVRPAPVLLEGQQQTEEGELHWSCPVVGGQLLSCDHTPGQQGEEAERGIRAASRAQLDLH